MEILNYTGKRIGLVSAAGHLAEILPIHGKATCEVEVVKSLNVGRIPIFEKKFGKVSGLPNRDLNFEKLYIVNREIADAFGGMRKDLLIAEQPVASEGAMYYKLSRAC